MAERMVIGNEADRVRAAKILKAGEIVVFPTDTVYGIGGDVHSSSAIKAIYNAKKRPTEKGLPVLLADVSDLLKVAKELSPLAQTLCEEHWPGPLTIIVHKRADLPTNLTPNDGVAVRVPDHAGTRKLIRLAGGALASSSANIASEPAANSAIEAEESLGDKVAAILDGGLAQHQQPSTIIDCRYDPPVLVRQGPLDLQLKELAKFK